MLIPIPLISYAFYSIKKRLKPLYRQQREQESQINSQMQEIINHQLQYGSRDVGVILIATLGVCPAIIRIASDDNYNVTMRCSINFAAAPQRGQ